MAQISGTTSGDVLVGTDFSDVFSGLSGNDTFVFTGRGSGQVDVIVDFGATYFGGAITPQQEVGSVSSTGVTPGAVSTASGAVSGWLNRAQTEFNFAAAVGGVDLGGQTVVTTDDVTAAHFHRGAAATSGSVVYGFIGSPNSELGGETVVNAPAGTVSGSWDLGEGNGTTLTAEVPFLLTNQLYVNFHTSTFPSGELRGQLNRLDSGLDQIDLRQTGITDFSTLQMFMTQVGTSTQISMTWNGAVNTLVLQNTPMASLSAADFIFADASAKTVFGTDGADILVGGNSDDFIFAEGGNDRVVAAQGNDWVEGRAGNDTIQGLEGNDTLSGGDGDDDVNGNIGQDVVNGDAGNDTVRGGQENDTIYGGAGNDGHVNGNLGNDIVYGGEGNDTGYGGQGDDTLYGEAGNDQLSGDLGRDILFGGAGADRFVLRSSGGDDWVADFNAAEGDRVLITTGQHYDVSNYNGQVLITLNGSASIGLAGVAFSTFDSSWVVFG